MSILFVQASPFLDGGEQSLFNAICRTANIDRKKIPHVEAFRGRGEPEDVLEWVRDPEQLDAASGAVWAAVREYHPNVLVAIGPVALRILTGHTNIHRYRGTPVLGAGRFDGMKVLPIHEPAFIMKTWKFYHVTVGDLTRAQDETRRGAKIVYPNKTLLLDPNLTDVVEYTAYCRKQAKETGRPVSTDIETGWGQITCIGFGPTPDEAMCIPFVDLRKPSRSYWPDAAAEAKVWRAVQGVLEDPDVPILGQNFLYDAIWLLEKMEIKVLGYREDTRLIHANLYPELPKSLEFMASAYTDVGAYKFWGGRYSDDKRDN